MTAPRDRQLGLARALQEFEELLASSCTDDPDASLTELPVYVKEADR